MAKIPLYSAVTFEYVKTGDDVSDRLAILVAKPTDLYTMLDVDIDSDVDVHALAGELKATLTALDVARRDAIYAICNKYTVAYKNFKEGGVHGLKEAD